MMVAVHFITIPTNLTQPIKQKKSHILVIFVPVLTTWCMLGLKFLELFLFCFMSVVRSLGMGKCTSRHVSSYRGFVLHKKRLWTLTRFTPYLELL